METDVMGRVLTEATIENLEDLWAVKRGLLPPEQVRKISIADALVDTGATLLSLPTQLIRQLGLSKTASKRVTSSIGLAEAAVYDAVNSIDRRHQPFAILVDAPKHASKEAATAQSAHDALLSLVPAQQANLDALLATSLAAT